MTATLDGVATKKDKPEPTAEQKLAEELVAHAREQGVSLTGPGGLLKQLTKTVLETVLNQEMTEHLGHDKHGLAGNEAGNVRNGTRPNEMISRSWRSWLPGSSRASAARTARPAQDSRGALTWRCRTATWCRRIKDLRVLDTVGPGGQGEPAQHSQRRQVGESY